MGSFKDTAWDNPEIFHIGRKIFKCGFCGKEVGSQTGFRSNIRDKGSIYICPVCRNPTYFDLDKNQFPAPIYGNDVKHLPDNIKDLYNEARRCMQVNAYTSSVMACRKLLMNIAVEKGAKKNESFVEYVNFLDKNHYTPPNSKEWVDKIRILGNDANHEIKLRSKEEAEDLINFMEMLLKFMYEFPGKIKPKEVTK